jgi:hypothetical protein
LISFNRFTNQKIPIIWGLVPGNHSLQNHSLQTFLNSNKSNPHKTPPNR